MEIEQFVDMLEAPKQLPSGISARCPAHDDRVSSLSINPGENGGIVVRCHAGCSAEQIVEAMHLTLADLMGKPYIAARYQYTDAAGTLLWTVNRWANPKDFRVDPGLPPPASRVLYNMVALDWARRMQATVFVCEGEKDADRLAMMGIPATTNVGGAGRGKWLTHYNQILAGLDVVVVADNDPPGKAHARHVAEQLTGHARSVTLMVSPIGKDVSDLLDAGYTIDALQLLPVIESAPVYLASQVPERRVSWAWQGYFPLGKLSIIEGDPGDGKSILTTDLAARWSTGAPMPDGTAHNGPWTVVMVSAEDDPEDTIRPRLGNAGADLNRVYMVTHGVTPDVPFDLTTDLPGLAAFIVEHSIKIVFIDPLSAFMGEKTDTHNDSSVRRALQPLKQLAAMTGAAVIAVRHLNKGSGGKAIYRGGGSIGFIGAARACYVVAQHPEDEDVRVFACVKTNLSKRPPSLTYTINSGTNDHPYITWGEALPLSAQQLLDGPDRHGNGDQDDELAGRRKAREYERAFLTDTLAGGPMTWADIVTIGKGEGFTPSALIRARSDLDLVKKWESEHICTWSLPESGAPKHQSEQSEQTSSAQEYGSAQQTGAQSGQKSGKLDQQAAPSSPVRPVQTLTSSGGQTGETDESGDDLYPDGTTAIDRDLQLAELPLVCSICKTTVGVNRYHDPWWTIRCVAHNPITYQGGQL